MPATTNSSPELVQDICGESSNRIVIYHEFDGDEFLIATMFCGYFEMNKTYINGNTTLRMLSKISTARIGTRMLSRGADLDGNASFLVETNFTAKQAVKDGLAENIDIFDFKVVRGNVPLLWMQPDPLKPRKIVFYGNEDENSRALVRHFDTLERVYSDGQTHRAVVALDLLGSQKYEKCLREDYRYYCKAHNVGYIHMDINKHANVFEELCAKFKAKIKRFIRKMIKNGTWERDGLDDKEIEDINEEELIAYIKRNKIIFRVNCLDCLDRSNLAQYMLFNIIVGKDLEIERQMWKRNGNALSNFYTGSDALKAELSKKGRLSLFGKMNDLFISASRMINNRFSDRIKQRSIEILLGKDICI